VQEAIVRKNDLVVGAARVCKEHRHPRRFSRRYERPELFPKPVNFGFGGYLGFGYGGDAVP
jgi:hypothetical protein